MTTEPIQTMFEQSLSLIAREFAVPMPVAFQSWVIANISDIEIEEALDSASLDWGEELGIDGVVIDDEDRTIHLFEIKSREDSTFTSDDLDRISKTTKSIAEKTKPIASIEDVLLRRRVSDLRDALDEKYNVNIHLVSRASLTPEFRAQAARLRTYPISSVSLYDKASILDLYSSGLTRDQKPPERAVLQYKEEELFPYRSEGREGLVATVRGSDVAEIEAKYGYALFQQNVRYYLTLKNRVNKRMMDTLKDPEKNPDFWCLNNGLSIVCKDFKLDRTTKQLTLYDMQIVNGCQTTMTLSEARKNGVDLSKSELLIKVIKTGEGDLRDRITESTNSQSAVKIRDFRANDLIQIKLQKDLERKGFGYVRKRGDRPSDNSFDAVIDMEKAAQLVLAFKLKKARDAKARKAALFSRESEGLYDEIFTPDLDAEVIIVAFKIYQLIEKEKAKYRSRKRDLLKRIREAQKKGAAADQLIEEIDDSEYLLHSDFHVLSLIADFIEMRYSKLSPTILQALRQSKDWSTLLSRLYDVACYHVGSFVKLRRERDVDFSYSKFFKTPSSMKDLLAHSADKRREWRLMERKDFLDSFPFPKL